MQKPIINRLFVKLAPGLAVVFAWLATSAFGVEPAELFLDGLRERQLHDLAIDYLERMKSSSLVTDEFKKRIPYELGVTFLARASKLTNTAERSSQINEARKWLEAFIKENPENALGLAARAKLAGAQVGHGRAIRRAADRLPDAKKDERTKRLEEARTFIQQGSKAFADAKAAYRKTLDAIPKDKPELANKRQEAGSNWLGIWFAGLRSVYEEIFTYPVGSPERKKLAKQTAKDLANLYGKYDTTPVGLEARLYEGRCHQEIGKLDQAINCYEDIAVQEDVQPWLRLLITKALRNQAECYLDQKKYDKVIKACSEWVHRARGDEARQPDWLAVQYHLATAYLRKADASKKDNEKKKLQREARDLFKYVSRQRKDYWKESRDQYAKLSRSVSASVPPAAKNFKEAFQLSMDALEQMTANKAAADAARLNAPDQVADFEEIAATNQADVRRYLELAMSLIGRKTDLDAVNRARSILCYMDYTERNYWRSAILGEFLAERYPDHPSSRNSAKIAMSSYQQLYAQGREAKQTAEELSFESRHIAEAADLIARRWPGTSDAAAAYGSLVSFALQERRIDDAKAHLNKIPENQRGPAELKVGSTIWIDYLTKQRLDEVSRPAPEELEKIKTDAVELLERGLAHPGDEVNSTVANAGLFVAQAHNQDAKYDQAIESLERARIGPLTLVKANDEAVARPGYDAEVYRTALHAYVLSTPPEREKAKEVMDALDGSMGDGDAESARKLTLIYISLGVQLQKRIEALQAEGRTDDVQQIAAAFEDFLERVSSRLANTDWTARRWLARAYYNLAEGLRGDKAVASLEAKPHYEKARIAYESLLVQAAVEKDFAPSDVSVLVVKKDMADCQRRLGKFSQALDNYASVLTEKPMMLNVQRAAAATYQEWGAEDPAKYMKAIGGDRRNDKGQNTIWGWAKLGNIARRVAVKNPEYESLYFEGWLNCAGARYHYAMTKEGADRTKHLQKAEGIIRTLYAVREELGGEGWKKKFDGLLKELQKAQDKKPTGLKGLNGK